MRNEWFAALGTLLLGAALAEQPAGPSRVPAPASAGPGSIVRPAAALASAPELVPFLPALSSPIQRCAELPPAARPAPVQEHGPSIFPPALPDGWQRAPIWEAPACLEGPDRDKSCPTPLWIGADYLWWRGRGARR
ncbi:MAG: hypothetical protein K2R98_13610 [Gemmataceae bacterium]|nr:hypothetical protein [Gemmataceae bacterium]